MSRAARTWFVTATLALVSTLPAVAVEPLILRINDASAVPGGTAAIVLRTYASKPIEQGQLCLEARPVTATASGPATNALSAAVFSDNQDTQLTFASDLTQAVQTFVLQFSSPTATINNSDGPLAAVLVDLDATLTPGQTFILTIDPANTFFFDANGDPIEILPRGGRLRIRDPSEPIDVGVEGTDVTPGNVAKLSLQTKEHLPLSSGRIGFVYDSAIAAGPPTTAVDPRHGQAWFTLDTSIPGLAVVDFVSDGSLNTIPGSVIDLYLPTLDTIPVGTVSPISLNSVALVDTAGQSLSLDLESSSLSFVPPPTMLPGTITDLRLRKDVSGMLELGWNPNCGDPEGYSVYRGDFALGYDSLAPVPGHCAIHENSALLPRGGDASELFLIVPHRAGYAGSYGVSVRHGMRAPIVGACFPPASETTTPGCQ